MSIISTLQNTVAQAISTLYGETIESGKVQVNLTPAGFSGDYSVVIFPFVKLAKKAPDIVAQEIGQFVQQNLTDIKGFNTVKGFLNLEIAESYWQQFLDDVALASDYGRQPRNGQGVLVEFSSPNTNKPLHLGHVRNILLGWSCAKILDAVGYDVTKVQIVNDRGVAICKSMVGWQQFGNGQTPEMAGVKSDHFVGDYYVLFENKSKAEYATWQTTDIAASVYSAQHKPGQTEADFFKEYKNKWFNEYSVLGIQVRNMLLQWENHDPAAIDLWQQMNGWVYAGFDQTYADLGVSFDKLYFESNTYLLGKNIVEAGLTKGVFYRKDDGSVWVDLTDAGYDQKLLLRADGTSVYITQDLGTSRMRYEDFHTDKMVYVVANEQDYHFAVLFETLKRLGEPYANGLYHLSYGLVELPSGRMKTREGTVVDADDLIAEVTRLAREGIRTRGEEGDIPEAEQVSTSRKVGMAALKYFIIKVHPHKKMIFNPEESVDMQGQTGPYIQYSYVRIHGLMQRVLKEAVDLSPAGRYIDFQPEERELLRSLHDYPQVIQAAATAYDPSLIANYCYTLAKHYHRFWQELKVFRADTEEAKAFRLQLSQAVGQVLQAGMGLIGIEMPERM